MSVLEAVEDLTTEVYGKGSAVSVDKVGSLWVIACWDKKGRMVDQTVPPLAKHDALASMKRRLTRASLLRLGPESDG